jgi:hypothetical protein
LTIAKSAARTQWQCLSVSLATFVDLRLRCQVLHVSKVTHTDALVTRASSQVIKLGVHICCHSAIHSSQRPIISTWTNHTTLGDSLLHKKWIENIQWWDQYEHIRAFITRLNYASQCEHYLPNWTPSGISTCLNYAPQCEHIRAFICTSKQLSRNKLPNIQHCQKQIKIKTKHAILKSFDVPSINSCC